MVFKKLLNLRNFFYKMTFLVSQNEYVIRSLNVILN
jgi:hypothetical protein